MVPPLLANPGSATALDRFFAKKFPITFHREWNEWSTRTTVYFQRRHRSFPYIFFHYKFFFSEPASTTDVEEAWCESSVLIWADCSTGLQLGYVGTVKTSDGQKLTKKSC